MIIKRRILDVVGLFMGENSQAALYDSDPGRKEGGRGKGDTIHFPANIYQDCLIFC